MKIGEVSEPITYRTDEGKDAVRILFYKARMPPHQASLEAGLDKNSDSNIE